MSLSNFAREIEDDELDAVQKIISTRELIAEERQGIEENVVESNDSENQSTESVGQTFFRPEYYCLPYYKRPYPLIVLLIVFVFFFADAIGATAQMDFVREIACRARFPDSSSEENHDLCKSPLVTGDIAWVLSAVNAVSSVCALFSAPRITALSDRMGRKPLILLNLSVTTVGYILVLVIYFHSDIFGYKAIFFATTLSNICGGVLTTTMLIKSYFSDSLQPTHRARYFSYISGTNAVALTVAPTLGSLITHRAHGDITLVMCISNLSVIVCLIFFSLVPESRDLKQRRLSQSSHSSSKGINHNWSIWNWRWWVSKIVSLDQLEKLKFRRIESNTDRRNAISLLFFSFFQNELLNGILPLLLVYPQNAFKWGSVETGFLLSELGFLQAFALFCIMPFLLKIFSKLWHTSAKRLDFVDLAFIRISLCGYILSQVLIIVARNASWYRIGTGILSLSSYSNPVVYSAIIKFTPKNEVGETLGALSFATSLGNIASLFIFMQIFNMTIEAHPTAVFICTLPLFVGLFLFSFIFRPVRTIHEDSSSVFRFPSSTNHERSRLLPQSEVLGGIERCP